MSYAAKFLGDAGHVLGFVSAEVRPFCTEPVNVWTAQSFSLGRTRAILPLPSLLRFIIRFKPDVVWCADVSLANLVLLAYCRLTDTPVVLSHHSPADSWVLEVLFLTFADAHLVCGDISHVVWSGGHHVTHWFRGIGVEYSRFRRSDTKRACLSTIPGKPIVICADSDSVNIQDSTRYTVAYVSGIDPDTMASGDVFYAPNERTEDYCLEAMACGLACVAPTSKMFGDAGVACGNKPIDAIHRALDTLPDLKRRAVQNAKKHGWDVSMRVLDDTLQQVVKASRV